MSRRIIVVPIINPMKARNNNAGIGNVNLSLKTATHINNMESIKNNTAIKNPKPFIVLVIGGV